MIVLINPPQYFHARSLHAVEQLPLGLLSIAGTLKEAGVPVSVIDALREGNRLTHEGKRLRYGLSWDEIGRRIRALGPAIVGISNPYSSQLSNAIETAKIVKAISGTITTVLGGVHPTVAADELIRKEQDIDICVRGEGEYVMRSIAEALGSTGGRDLGAIPGIVYREGGAVRSGREPEPIEELDRLPRPAYESIDLERYLREPCALKPLYPSTARVVEMMTSRGCPHNCIFCSVQCVMGRRFRGHSPQNILSHIEYLITKYGVRHIRFNDDNISMDRGRFEAILDGILERELAFSWDCPNGVRADTLDEGLIGKMKRAGCERLYLAAESGDQEVVNAVVGKQLDLSCIERALEHCRDAGIETGVYFVLGMPGETLKTMRRTESFARKLHMRYNAEPLFFAATPLPGTRLLEICRNRGYVTKEIDEGTLSELTQGRAVIRTDAFSPEDVTAIIRRANRHSAYIRRARALVTRPGALLRKLAKTVT